MSNRIIRVRPIRITKAPSKDQLSSSTAGRAKKGEGGCPPPHDDAQTSVDLDVTRSRMYVEDHSTVADLALDMVFGDGALYRHLMVYSERPR